MPVDRLPLDVSTLADPGGSRLAGLRVEVVESAASTNALVVARAKAGAADGLVVVAEHQTAGRGRLDRTWETPARSGLTFSLLLRPTVPAASWPWLPLLVGYAVVKALRAHGWSAGVKWPNDVLLGEGDAEGKVAGILVERVETSQGPAAVVGVGLNVSLTEAELPVPTATSLALVPGGGPVPDRTGLLVSLLVTLREAFDAWEAGGEAAAGRLRSSYASACVTLGRDVRVDLPAGATLTGRAVDIDAGGRLVVDGPDGPTPVGAGDVVHVRSLR